MTATNIDTTLSNQIYLSRDNIRNQIIEYVKYYLEIENVELVKGSFLSFLIDTLSTLTSNLLFYSSSTYKEFFLTTAQLPDSIFNLSAFLGYNTTEATYALANVLMNIPLEFDDANTTFYIPENFKFYAGDTEFVTYYDTTIAITNNTSVSIDVVQDGNKTYNLPVNIDTTSVAPSFSFILPVRQYKEVIQEFQIDSDVPLYQFINIDIQLAGKVSSMIVEVRDPDSTSWRTYAEFKSVYLMSSTDYGYVSRRTDSGRRLIFGNGLIGVQPIPGSTIKVSTHITEGLDGNVIASTIKRGDRIYVTDSYGRTKIISYTAINPSPATGGTDEQSLEEIRKDSIANLVTLSRLVSEYDYKHAGVVMPLTPIADNTLPVLKRSDVKCNEIQLYTILEFGTASRISSITEETITENIIVPTRNAKYTIPLSTLYIPRETIIPINSIDYYTLFDINVDLMNSAAYYDYIMYEVENVPVLSTSYGIVYDIICSNLKISKSGNTALFELYYSSTESDYDLCTAKLKVVNTSLIYSMTNDSDNKKFTYSFDPYTLFPEDNIDLELTIYLNSGASLATYTSEVTFRKSLNDFTMSNLEFDSTAQTTIVYDIPVIEKDYYDTIVKKDFEQDVLQKMMTVMDFKNYRMLTDFTNLKFTNTTGTMVNMKYNPVTKSDCIDIDISDPPTNPSVGDRYIIGCNEGGLWNDKNNQIAQCIDTTGTIWYFFPPITDDIIYVTNKKKKYIYNGNNWSLMEYQIPLTIEAEIFKSPTYFGSDVQLSNLIKDTLLSEYSSRFGPNITLYRSEITKTIQNISGVGHCNLIKPESNIFFEYELDTLTETELLEYSPEYIYFNTDSISVRVYS